MLLKVPEGSENESFFSFWIFCPEQLTRTSQCLLFYVCGDTNHDIWRNYNFQFCNGASPGWGTETVSCELGRYYSWLTGDKSNISGDSEFSHDLTVSSCSRFCSCMLCICHSAARIEMMPWRLDHLKDSQDKVVIARLNSENKLTRRKILKSL